MSRLRESNLLSVGWSWLPGVFPPAYSFLCNIHCNSADRHLLARRPRRPQSVDTETGNEFCSPRQLSCLSLLLLQLWSNAGIPLTSTISPSLHQAQRLQIWRASDSLSLTLCSQVWKRLLFHKQCLPFVCCQGKRESRCKGKISFFKRRWRAGYWKKPKQEPEIADRERKAQNNPKLEEKPRQRFLEEAAAEEWEVK